MLRDVEETKAVMLPAVGRRELVAPRLSRSEWREWLRPGSAKARDHMAGRPRWIQDEFDREMGFGHDEWSELSMGMGKV